MISYLTDVNNIEQNSIDIINKLNDDSSINDIFVFPDVHISTSESIPVGVCFSTAPDKFYPLVSGKDIGCGVAFAMIPKRFVDRLIVKEYIYKSFYKAHLTFTDEGLGGGNHFLAIEEDEDNLYIVCHTGTRNNGISFYQRSKAVLEDFRVISGKDNIDYIDIDYLNDINHDNPEYFTANGNFFKQYNNLLEYSKKRRSKFIDKTIEYLIRAKILNTTVLENYEICDSIHNYIEFQDDKIIHRKGVTGFNGIVACPMSMTRGTIYVKKTYDYALNSCAHGAGRKFSRSDALNYWNSTLKNKDRLAYQRMFPEYLVNGNFPKDIVTEFDFAYKSDDEWLSSQPHIKKVYSSTPIVTIKFVM